MPNNESITPIDRLRQFVQWAKKQGFCTTEGDFERQCGLASKYIANNKHSGKGNIGTEMLGRIAKVYPQLNLFWVCTGEESMLNPHDGKIDLDYKQAYEGAMMQIEALNRIIKRNG